MIGQHMAREVQYLRDKLPRSQEWEVMVDSFFWRDPESCTSAGSKVLEKLPMQERTDVVEDIFGPDEATPRKVHERFPA